MVIWWAENRPNEIHRSEIFNSMAEGVQLIKKPAILSLAITDSIYQCSIQIFIFTWTPVLQITAESKQINPGMIFLMGLITFLIQNKILELLNKLWKINYFILMTCYGFCYMLQFFFIYLINDYAVRLILLAFINVYII
jgi:hypothetical protein